MPTLKVCNCAACNKELVSAATRPSNRGKRPVVGGRIAGRPYCASCYYTEITGEPAPGIDQHDRYLGVSDHSKRSASARS